MMTPETQRMGISHLPRCVCAAAAAHRHHSSLIIICYFTLITSFQHLFMIIIVMEINCCLTDDHRKEEEEEKGDKMTFKSCWESETAQCPQGHLPVSHCLSLRWSCDCLLVILSDNFIKIWERAPPPSQNASPPHGGEIQPFLTTHEQLWLSSGEWPLVKRKGKNYISGDREMARGATRTRCCGCC